MAMYSVQTDTLVIRGGIAQRYDCASHPAAPGLNLGNGTPDVLTMKGTALQPKNIAMRKKNC